MDSATHYVEVQVTSAGETTWFIVRVALEVFVGLLLLVGATLLTIGRERLGSTFGYFGLLLSLTVVNLLVFYYDQFRATLSAVLQFTVLLGVILYRQRYLVPKPGSELPEGGHPDEAAGSDAPAEQGGRNVNT